MKISILCLLVISQIVKADHVLSCDTGEDPKCGLCQYGKCEVCWGTIPNSSGICHAPAVAIEHCMGYKSDGTCWECSEGYIQDGKLCKKLKDPKCIFEKDGKCTQCLGYVSGLATCSEKCADGCLHCVKSGDKQICNGCFRGYVESKEDPADASNTAVKCTKVSGDNDDKCLFAFSTGSCIGCVYGNYISSKTDATITCKERAAILSAIVGLSVFWLVARLV